jgi:hypothetical protein
MCARPFHSVKLHVHKLTVSTHIYRYVDKTRQRGRERGRQGQNGKERAQGLERLLTKVARENELLPVREWCYTTVAISAVPLNPKARKTLTSGKPETQTLSSSLFASCGGRREVFWCDELQMMMKTTTTTTENEREMDLQRRTRPQDIALELQES